MTVLLHILLLNKPLITAIIICFMDMRKAMSIWIKTAGVANPNQLPPRFPTLAHLPQRHYDAIVVGGGVFGTTVAYKLKEAGKKVALIEGRTIGSGTSSFSTAKLSAQQGPIYSSLVQKHNDSTALNYYHMNMRGISIFEEIIGKLSLDCHHDKRQHIMWTSDPKNIPIINKEYDTCKRLGIPCHLLQSQELLQDLPDTIAPLLGLGFPDQSIFNPYLYCTELSQRIPGDGCDVFENSRVSSIEVYNPIRVICEEHNCTFTADKLVLATHLPIMDRSLHFAYLEPSKSHCIAAKIRRFDQTGEEGKGDFTKEKAESSEEHQDDVKGKNIRGRNIHHMYINVDMPMRSMRSSHDGNYLIVAGESIPQGEKTDTQIFYDNLINWVNQNFYVDEITSHWSAMDYYSGDHIPMIGHLYRGTDSIFTATAMSKWGLANGIAAAEIITDLIEGRENPYTHMVDARRVDIHQAKGFLLENLHTAEHFIKDKFKSAFTTRNILSLQPDEGDLVKVGLRTVGAYRDPQGVYHIVNPVCTHLGCSLLFNSGDKVWDCPCHGSQYDVDGSVIHGPAVKPLTKLTDIEW